MSDSSSELSVWTKLSSINVNENTEKKGMFTYLSWAWAWGIVKENYPDATYEIHDNIFYPDESVETRVSVTIADQTHTMWLPVMDNKKKPIHKPNARHISDTRMRCFVKAIAMHGLGHYIYAGEDIPQAVEENANQEADREEPIPQDVKKYGGKLLSDLKEDELKELKQMVTTKKWSERIDSALSKFNTAEVEVEETFRQADTAWLNL